MSASELSLNLQHENKKSIINVAGWIRNQIANLYNIIAYQHMWLQDETHIQKDCRAYVKLLFYEILEWWIMGMDEKD